MACISILSIAESKRESIEIKFGRMVYLKNLSKLIKLRPTSEDKEVSKIKSILKEKFISESQIKVHIVH